MWRRPTPGMRRRRTEVLLAASARHVSAHIVLRGFALRDDFIELALVRTLLGRKTRAGIRVFPTILGDSAMGFRMETKALGLF